MVKLMPSTARKVSGSGAGLRRKIFAKPPSPLRGYLARRRGLHHAALLHDHHAVAIGGGQAEVVGDEDRRHAALLGELDDEVHHRLLRRHVEAGRRLVGDEQLGTAGERERDHHALAHAARELERIGVVALARAGDTDLVEYFDRLVRERGGIHLRMLLQHVLDLPPDFADRIQGRARVLEDHRHFAPAQVAHLILACGAHVEAGEMHCPGGDASGAIQDAHHRIGGDRFAGAGLADDADGLALGDAHIDVLHRAHDAAARREFDGEVCNIEERNRFGHGGLRCAVADRRCRAARRRAG
jgi:hypothetical protein